MTGPNPKRHDAKRRGLLKLGLALGLVAVATARPWRGMLSELRFEPIARAPGFRRLLSTGGTGAQVSGAQVSGAQVSGAQIATIGLPPSPEMAALEPSDALRTTIHANPAAALFPGPGSATGIVPIAYFTDIRCPICRQVERDLDTLLEEEGDLAMVTHEYPVFGAASIAAARHILAATEIGRGEALRHRLQLSAGLTPVHLRRAAAAEGLDPEALARRAMSDDITARLQTSWGLGGLFGFAGTPALVIGRTSILGARPIGVLRAVIDAERQA